MRHIPSEITRQPRKLLPGSTSMPERAPVSSVYRAGQGRLVILFTLAFELLLGFPEARDARCDFGAVARESFFLLRHRPSVSCFDSRPAMIGAREWGMNAEARLRHCDRLQRAKRTRWISCGAFLSLMR